MDCNEETNCSVAFKKLDDAIQKMWERLGCDSRMPAIKLQIIEALPASKLLNNCSKTV